MLTKVIVALACGFVAGGCSSQIVHSEIQPDLAPGSKINGVPYRVPTRFKATIYEKTAEGYAPLHKLDVLLPDPGRLYVLGFRSQPLSTATLDIQMNGDNTLKELALTSSATGAAALTAAGTGLTTVATAEQARRTAEKTADTAAATAATTGATAAATAAIVADKAKQAADLAELQYQIVKADPKATAQALLAAANVARSAKLDANEAARLAGRSPYFPDVIP